MIERSSDDVAEVLALQGFTGHIQLGGRDYELPDSYGLEGIRDFIHPILPVPA